MKIFIIVLFVIQWVFLIVWLFERIKTYGDIPRLPKIVEALVLILCPLGFFVFIFIYIYLEHKKDKEKELKERQQGTQEKIRKNSY